MPCTCRYDSFNADVVKQHAIWFIESGVDFLVVDWTNNAWQVTPSLLLYSDTYVLCCVYSCRGLTNFSQRGELLEDTEHTFHYLSNDAKLVGFRCFFL